MRYLQLFAELFESLLGFHRSSFTLVTGNHVITIDNPHRPFSQLGVQYDFITDFLRT